MTIKYLYYVQLYISQGIGIGLVISQAMIGIYTAVGVSWMFIYFRDSFITRYDQYRWGKCFRDYRGKASAKSKRKHVMILWRERARW